MNVHLAHSKLPIWFIASHYTKLKTFANHFKVEYQRTDHRIILYLESIIGPLCFYLTIVTNLVNVIEYRTYNWISRRNQATMQLFDSLAQRSGILTKFPRYMDITNYQFYPELKVIKMYDEYQTSISLNINKINLMLLYCSWLFVNGKHFQFSKRQN